MKLLRTVRVFALALMLLFLAASFAGAEEMALAGEWVYQHDPAVTVLTLRQDASAVYAGQELTWRDTENGLLLTDAAGESFCLAYEAAESGLTVWLPTLYTRVSEIGADGEITGTWKAQGKSQSSYVFTEDGRFLEDGVFTGNFLDDPEQGRITLQYAQGMFRDTLILYSFDGSSLVIAYPWQLIRK